MYDGFTSLITASNGMMEALILWESIVNSQCECACLKRWSVLISQGSPRPALCVSFLTGTRAPY